MTITTTETILRPDRPTWRVTGKVLNEDITRLSHVSAKHAHNLFRAAALAILSKYDRIPDEIRFVAK